MAKIGEKLSGRGSSFDREAGKDSSRHGSRTIKKIFCGMYHNAPCSELTFMTFLKEYCLLNQSFIMSDKDSVEKYLKGESKKMVNGSPKLIVFIKNSH